MDSAVLNYKALPDATNSSSAERKDLVYTSKDHAAIKCRFPYLARMLDHFELQALRVLEYEASQRVWNAVPEHSRVGERPRDFHVLTYNCWNGDGQNQHNTHRHRVLAQKLVDPNLHFDVIQLQEVTMISFNIIKEDPLIQQHFYMTDFQSLYGFPLLEDRPDALLILVRKSFARAFRGMRTFCGLSRSRDCRPFLTLELGSVDSPELRFVTLHAEGNRSFSKADKEHGAMLRNVQFNAAAAVLQVPHMTLEYSHSAEPPALFFCADTNIDNYAEIQLFLMMGFEDAFATVKGGDFDRKEPNETMDALLNLYPTYGSNYAVPDVMARRVDLILSKGRQVEATRVHLIGEESIGRKEVLLTHGMYSDLFVSDHAGVMAKFRLLP